MGVMFYDVSGAWCCLFASCMIIQGLKAQKHSLQIQILLVLHSFRGRKTQMKSGPNFVEEIHERLIYHERYGHIETHTR